MGIWHPKRLAELTNGKWLGKTPTRLRITRGVCIDTRILTPGQAFLALVGEHADGHDYLIQAVTAGAKLLIVSDKKCIEDEHIQKKIADVPVLWVADVTLAIQELAQSYRQILYEHRVKVIAVTGSNGKTSTRHLIHTALSSTLDGTQSYKSYNNHWGVPITLLAADINDDFVIVEVGSNAPGEIDALAQIIKPDAAVITNIGTAHLGNFGSIVNIAKEKLAIFNHVLEDGAVVLPEDDLLPDQDMQVTVELMQGTQMMRYGYHQDSDVYILDATPRQEGFDLKINLGVEFFLNMPGYHNTVNVLAAFCIAQWMGLDSKVVAQALAACQGVPMRHEIMPYGDEAFPLVVINDAYNSNYQSVEAALMTLATYAGQKPARRRIAILGDMLEMGEFAPELHKAVGQMIVAWDNQEPTNNMQPTFDHVILIGQLSQYTAAILAGVWNRNAYTVFKTWQEDLPDRVAELLKLGDLVLIKGSRAMALERLLQGIEKKFGKLTPKK